MTDEAEKAFEALIGRFGRWLEDDTHRLLTMLTVFAVGAFADIVAGLPFGITGVIMFLPVVAFWTWWRTR